MALRSPRGISAAFVEFCAGITTRALYRLRLDWPRPVAELDEPAEPLPPTKHDPSVAQDR